MQRKTWYSILGLDAKPLSTKLVMLNKKIDLCSKFLISKSVGLRSLTFVCAFTKLTNLLYFAASCQIFQNKPQATLRPTLSGPQWGPPAANSQAYLTKGQPQLTLNLPNITFDLRISNNSRTTLIIRTFWSHLLIFFF